ncbi:hypothetical protein Cadr_000002929 [Camelus dromedarius]|uniref:Uncharacterized protein n=1 Tax=Camelus dromedarius TaxID=9838 RepID=A0A5N4C0N3_CAMDR|nr:hypothetical protein Cadr_000002929 [Camelus dromedarius]
MKGGPVTPAELPPGGAKQRLEGKDTWGNWLRSLSTCRSSRSPLPPYVPCSQDDNTCLPSTVLMLGTQMNPTRSSTPGKSQMRPEHRRGHLSPWWNFKQGTDGIRPTQVKEAGSIVEEGRSVTEPCSCPRER